MAFPLPKKFYLFGYPIAHSAAPALHNHCFKSLGTANAYTLWSTSNVTEEMLAVIRSSDFGGAAQVQVTMPLKTAIIPFLDELSLESQATSACNTIVKVPTADGRVKLVGQNTDILGVRNALLSALREQHPTAFIPSDASASYPSKSDCGPLAGLVIGGGATTRSAAQALAMLGLSPIFLINRDADEVRAVVSALPHLSAQGALVHLVGPADVEAHLVGEGKARILMAVGCIPSVAPQTIEERMVYTTTSAALTIPYAMPSDASPVLPYPTRRLFLEMPYKPVETTMYKVAAAHGWHVIDGVEAMIEQGLAQQRMWARGAASIAVGSDASILGVDLEAAARKYTRDQLVTSPVSMAAIETEVDRAAGKDGAVLSKQYMYKAKL
ncbi:hypothetical protein GGX14DRAFT_344185 [Mycena pura]|uniref:Shikimate dehydrogenase substrate binding N-terminal domain-containing protein n=1 Tax=Mycena pura TaxID=153505 RepID=A0AAD6YVF1_9AGAR|nr:hypothetical protein GGX14DRAFT_344185 [Mycena pura]